MTNITWTVTLTRADGYVFNYGFDTLDGARVFMVKTVAVTLPGETITLTAN